MAKGTRFVGLDVHAQTIAVAVAEPSGEVRSLGTIPNRPESVRKLVRKLGEGKKGLAFCYEAGPTGYALYWLLVAMGQRCDVVAPTLVPVKAGDRVKTDRRDALKLARCFRAGDLTRVFVPDAQHEALRDLVRLREGAKRDQLRFRNRLSKFLLRQGRRPPDEVNAWTKNYMEWVRAQKFELPPQEAAFLDCVTEVDHVGERITRLEKQIDEAIEKAPTQIRAVIEALQALRGVARVTAATIVAEVGELSRFDKPTKLMAYAGVVPSEDSSGESIQRGAITKTGNAHLRRVLGEAAWAYRHRPTIGKTLRKRQANCSEAVKEIALKAQHRLYDKHRRLTEKGKTHQKVVTALARELLGFIWAIGTNVEAQFRNPETARKAA